MRTKSDAAKQREGYGKGEGAGYKPYITAREFNSKGTAVTLRDYKTGRSVELLSQGEAMYWHLLRFQDDVLEIREQLPLPLEETNRLAKELGIKPAWNGKSPMTTDFFIVFKDHHVEAHSFKPSVRSLERDRTVELLSLEKAFWDSKKVQWELIFKTGINQVFATNIRICSYFWNESNVFDFISCMKHMIIHKEISTDMENAVLDFPAILQNNFIAVNDKMSSLQNTEIR